MKTHYDGHDLAQTQPLLAPPLPTPVAHQMLLPQGLKRQTEVVKVAEQGYNLHDENLLGGRCWLHSPPY
jgi:hypothetical protein